MRIALSVVALLATTTLASAQGQTPVADWTGAYGGLSFSMASGPIDVTLPSGFAQGLDWEDSSAIGGFAGYNWQNGNLVYGVEFTAIFTIEDMMVPGAGTVDDFAHNFVDLRGRVGYAAGDALIYGALGLSAANATYNVSDDTFHTGVSVGVGVDYQINDQMFLGLDYTTRILEGSVTNPVNPFEVETTFNTISLRLGYRF